MAARVLLTGCLIWGNETLSFFSQLLFAHLPVDTVMKAMPEGKSTEAPCVCPSEARGLPGVALSLHRSSPWKMSASCELSGAIWKLLKLTDSSFLIPRRASIFSKYNGDHFGFSLLTSYCCKFLHFTCARLRVWGCWGEAVVLWGFWCWFFFFKSNFG